MDSGALIETLENNQTMESILSVKLNRNKNRNKSPVGCWRAKEL